MPSLDAKKFPVPIAHVVVSVAEGVAVSYFDDAMPQAVHAVRKPDGWTVVVKVDDFEWSKNIPGHCSVCDHAQAVQRWVDEEIGCPLAEELAAHFHSPPGSG